MMVPPGFSLPSASASSIIVKAIRSFTEFPGLKVSYLASTKAGISPIILLIFTIGVLPMVPNIFSAYSINLFKERTPSHKASEFGDKGTKAIGFANDYSNRIALTREIFEIIKEGIKSIKRQRRNVPAFRIKM